MSDVFAREEQLLCNHYYSGGSSILQGWPMVGPWRERFRALNEKACGLLSDENGPKVKDLNDDNLPCVRGRLLLVNGRGRAILSARLSPPVHCCTES